MAKAVQTTTSGETLTFKTLAELGYAQAKTGDSLTDQAKFALEKIAGFPETVSDEAKAELYSGYQKRWNEKHPAEMYAVINGHYVKASTEHIENKAVEKVEIGFDYAFALTSQEFGKLKNAEPERHAIVAKVREAVSVYCSNRLGDLKREANKILNKSTPRTRTTLDFVQSVTKVFDALEKSVKVKQGKGDTTANQLQYRMAKDAFWKAYNAK
jgi:hypothetical protein